MGKTTPTNIRGDSGHNGEPKGIQSVIFFYFKGASAGPYEGVTEEFWLVLVLTGLGPLLVSLL